MDIEIIIRNATLAETRELFAVVPEGTTISKPKRAGCVENLREKIWSDEEVACIKGIPEREDALQSYRAAFPDSVRTKHAVYRKHQYLKEDKKEIFFKDDFSVNGPDFVMNEGKLESVPARIVENQLFTKNTPATVTAVTAQHREKGIIDEKKPGVDMRKRPYKTRKNKWQIPFIEKEDPKPYHAAYALCKKYNLPYPEAVIKEAAEKHISESSPVTSTLENPSPLLASIIKPPVTMDQVPVTTIVSGMKVKQIKPDRTLHLKGTMLVLARRAGLIECLHEGKRHTIDAKCLEVVEVVSEK